MDFLDIRTVTISHLITNVIIVVVFLVLWSLNRKRYNGFGAWLIGLLLNLFGMALLAMRNTTHEFVPVILGNTCIVLSQLYLLIGLKRFLGKPNRHFVNIALLLAFVFIQYYFLAVTPNLEARIINFSIVTLAIGVQTARLALIGAEKEYRPLTRNIGLVFVLFCILTFARIVSNLVNPPGEMYFSSGPTNAVYLLGYQMMFLAFTFAFVLMINQRLVSDLEKDIQDRTQIEQKLQESEALYRQMFFNHSAVMLLVNPTTGMIVGANPASAEYYGYSMDELQKMRVSDINQLPVEKITRLLQEVQAQQSNYNIEPHKLASGEIRTVEVYSIPVDHQSERLNFSIIYDINDRLEAEKALVKLATVEERQRMARDLHDSANQSIHSLVLFAETLTSTLEKNNIDRAKQLAVRIQESARQALKETRLMLYELQPSSPDRSINLIPDLEARLVTVERYAGVKAQILQEGSLDECPPKWHENMFWITIEALNNALKHAQARSIKIYIRRTSNHLELEIVDNGIGFDASNPREGGYGLTNMKDRARQLGGEIKINSLPGEGTQILFRATIKDDVWTT